MGKSIKIKFDRDATLSCKRVHKGDQLALVTYVNGKCEIQKDGFHHIIQHVDELIATMKPLDDYITEISFVAKNYDGSKNKLGVKIIGVLGDHIIWEADGEMGDDIAGPLRKKDNLNRKATVLRTADIGD